MTDKTPIRAVFDGSTATGLAEFQTGEKVPVNHGGTGAVTHTANSILLGNGTSALQSSEIQISGTTLSSSDSTTISIAEGLIVTGDLTVQGTTTTVDSSTINVVDRFVFEGSSDDENETTLVAANPDADRTVTIPNATGTIVLKDTADTLTNKTINASNNTLSNIGNSSLSNSTITIGDESSNTSDISLGDELSIIGGAGIDTAINANLLTISVPNGGISNTQLANSSVTVNGTEISLGGSGTIEAVVNPITFGDDSSNEFDVNTGESVSFLGGEGMNTAISGPFVTISGEDATTSNKGIASFNSSHFSVSSGAVSLSENAITINGTSVALGGSATIEDSEIALGSFFSNANTVGTNTTLTTASTKNAFLCGDLTVSGSAVLTIDGDGTLEMI